MKESLITPKKRKLRLCAPASMWVVEVSEPAASVISEEGVLVRNASPAAKLTAWGWLAAA